MRRFGALVAIQTLSACSDAFSGLSGALDGQGFDQRLAFAAMIDQPAGTGGVTAAIRVAALSAAGEGVLFRSVVPFDDRMATADALVWRDTAARLAAQVEEPIPGGTFDKWVFVYDRHLDLEFAASDDNLAGDMEGTCAPIQTSTYQDLVDEVVAQGGLPAGTVVKLRPGTGRVIAGGFEGWLSDAAFVARIDTDPETFVEEPGGVENSAFLQAMGLGTLGEIIPLYGTYVLSAGDWVIDACSDVAPAIPARGAPLQEVTVSGGSLLVAGTLLLTPGGDPLAGPQGAVLADGSY